MTSSPPECEVSEAFSRSRILGQKIRSTAGRQQCALPTWPMWPCGVRAHVSSRLLATIQYRMCTRGTVGHEVLMRYSINRWRLRSTPYTTAAYRYRYSLLYCTAVCNHLFECNYSLYSRMAVWAPEKKQKTIAPHQLASCMSRMRLRRNCWLRNC